MSQFKKLPRSGPWEVDIISAPGVRIRGVELEGMLLVVEAQTGQVRAAAPIPLGEDLRPHLVEAAVQSEGHMPPERPRTLLCRPDFAMRLRPAAAALGFKLKLQTRVPGVEEASDSLLAHMAGAPSSDCMPQDPKPWRPLLAELVKEAPWRGLSDAVEFIFPEGPALLADGVALVLGQAGEQYGVVFYEDWEDYEAFMECAGDLDALDELGLGCWCAHLDPPADFEPGDVDRRRKAGLVHGGLALRLYAYQGAGVRSLEAEEEEAMLAVLQGILALWRSAGPALEDEVREIEAQTAVGRLLVVGGPDQVGQPLPRLIVEAAHRVGMTVEGPPGEEGGSLIIKAAKADAQRLVGRLRGLDAVSLDASGPDTFDVTAWAGNRQIGVLVRAPAVPAAWRPWLEQGCGTVVVSAGGAKRATYSPHNYLASFPVELLRDAGGDDFDDDDDDDYDDEEPLDPANLLDPSALRSVDWTRPPEEWPKASTVLLVFGDPLALDRLPPQARRPAIDILITVWNAVVLADLKGQPQLLQEARRMLKAEPQFGWMVDRLIERKRRLFPHDRRLMRVGAIVPRPGGFDLQAGWTLP